MSQKFTVFNRNRATRCELPDEAFGYGISGGTAGYVNTRFNPQGQPIYNRDGTPTGYPPGPTPAALDWNNLIWNSPPTLVIGNASGNENGAETFVSVTDIGEYLNDGQLTYTGPAVVCNLHFTVIDPNSPDPSKGRGGIVITDITNSVTIINQQIPETAGEFDFPFTIPSSNNITYNVNQGGFALAGVTISFTTEITPHS